MISVESWGVATAIVDQGRLGLAWLGHSRGGAVDAASLALANRLVGNSEGRAGIETSGALVLRFREPTMVAVAGAVADVSVVGGPALGWGGPVVLPAGAQLRVGQLREGARVYLSVRGGLQRSGDELGVGRDPGSPAATQPAARASIETRLRIWPGPRLDWLRGDAWDALLTSQFVVASTSRVGIRLSGTRLQTVNARQLPSEGLVEGAIQVPPDGQPIIMLADHPTTGGYPVIAVVDPADLHHAAQAAVGTTLRFTPAR